MLLYSTVKVWPACDVTSKVKVPPIQVALVSASWAAATVVKLPPVNPPKGTPAGFWPFVTVHQIVRFAGKGANVVQVTTVLPALQDWDVGRRAYVIESTR